ncbi:hypothetical protein CBS101457_000986 [Exobasidium rhododendri]|nr:hypothetical protein CBS101457_000986 [Exobasidium rhododendri]
MSSSLRTASLPHSNSDYDEKGSNAGLAAKRSASSNEDGNEKEESDSSKSQLEPSAEQEAAYQYNPGARGFIHVKKRERFYQWWRPRELPPPPPLSLDDAELIPLENAGFVSIMTYQWAQPMMVLGYQRALEATDLWKLGPSKGSEVQSQRLLALWEKQVVDLREYNEKLESGEIKLGMAKKFKWQRENFYSMVRGNGSQNISIAERERLWRMPPPASSTASATAATAPTKGAKKERNYSGHKEPQIYAALISMFKRELLIANVIKVVGDVAQMTSPLLIRVMIEYGEQKYAHLLDPTNPLYPNPSDGIGVGYAIALFVMQLLTSLCQHQFFFRTMSVGVHARSTLISAIFTRSLKLGGKNRSPGKLLNHASTDCSRIDFAAQWGPLALSSPFALALCLGLLIWQIRVSALVGFGVLVVSMPVQAVTMKSMFTTRKSSMQWTDKRSKLINEILTSIRVVKSFAQESKFLERLSFLRNMEMRGIRKLMIIRSFNTALAFSIPVIAAVVAFIVYYQLENNLNPARLFTALTLFQLLRMPLMFLPLSFSALTDGYNASLRLNAVFLAEQLEDKSEKDPNAKYALNVQDSSFEYEEVKKEDNTDGKASKKAVAKASSAATAQATSPGSSTPRDRMRKALRMNAKSGNTTPAATHGSATPKDVSLQDQLKAEQSGDLPGDHDDAIISGEQELEGPRMDAETSDPTSTDKSATASTEKPFRLDKLNLRVDQGELVAIVGPVGCGKSTLFESLLGEVKMLEGKVTWGGDGRVAYCPQSSWIQAASVRENILFGRPYEAERYWEIIKICELESDLVILPQGDFTEIGEKGTSLSGGQKARVGLARALYFDASTYMLDDPLSAVDPHVGKALFNNAILGLKAQGKTILLATHAIHVLPQTDRIITMLDGEIVESGTYTELENANGAFKRLVEEFGGQEEEEEEEEEGIENAGKAGGKLVYKRSDMTDFTGNKTALMDQEERNTGVVGDSVWGGFFRAGHGWILIPLLLLAVSLMQASTVLNSYWLVWWQDAKFGDLKSNEGLYMGVYAALGIIQAIFTFLMGAASGIFTYYAAQNLHADAITRVLYAPLNTFFDVQPKGRILNRFTKDIDTIDNTLPDSMRMAVSTLGTVLGAIILITILTYYFVVAVAGVLVFYVVGSLVYQRGAREVKRLDAVLRSSLYSHFSETLSGLATVRAYQETARFKADHIRHMDIENRAYFFSICNQRFLGIRLDFLGCILVFVVALLATIGANSINPAQVGLALSFMLTVSQAFSWASRQVSEVLNDMNSAERIQYYANDLMQEKPQEVPEFNLDPAWPKSGGIEFDNVVLRYREGLPIVLNGITMEIAGGEKTAIVGRTGAGKSSLLTCLLRLIELEEGSIKIDGVDVSKIGLLDLRSRIGYLPQEPILFSGTIRSNLDPFGLYDDARLNDALKRSYLVAAEEADHSHGNVNNNITLDTTLEEEGGNLSLGQRSLVSLARALVKDSQIILLDEATASVDVQTDALIQDTIRKEFAHKTLLTIAHRLRTIISYDKIAVFEKGCLAEYDTPLKLFDRGEIFRDMCEKANLAREEIVRAQQSRT